MTVQQRLVTAAARVLEAKAELKARTRVNWRMRSGNSSSASREAVSGEGAGGWAMRGRASKWVKAC